MKLTHVLIKYTLFIVDQYVVYSSKHYKHVFRAVIF